MLIWTDSSGEEHRITPRILLEALDDACKTMSYSNWHNDKFRRIQEIIRRHYEGKYLGQSDAQARYHAKRKHAAKWKKLGIAP